MRSRTLATSHADLAIEESASLWQDLREIVAEYGAYRELLGQFVRRDIRIRYKQAVMGFGWAVFMPMLIVLSGVVVRYAMAQLSGGRLEGGAVAGLAVKALPWAFFVGSIGFAAGSLIGNAGLITKIYFPREIVPVSAVAAQAFDALVGTAALAVALPFLGVRPGLALFWLPLLAVLLFLLTAAAALLLSAANLFFRDVKYIVQVLLTFGIFFTPVFYEPAMLGDRGAHLVMLNPVAPLLEGMRLAVVEGHDLVRPLLAAGGAVAWSPWHLAYSAGWAVLGLLGASLLFHRLERLFAEYV